MTYAIGADLEASDFNNFATMLNDIQGVGIGDSGYGKLPIGLVPVGDDVGSTEWLALIQGITDSATHQGTIVDLPDILDIQPGDDILCYDGTAGRPNIPLSIGNITAGRLNTAITQTTIQNAISSQRLTGWSNQIVHSTEVSFSDQDHARHFFNSGGEIRISANRVGGSISTQNTDWSNLLSGAGTIVFTGSDYFALTTTNTIFNSTTSLHYAYTSNDWTILVKTNTIIDPNSRGGKGNIITFEIQFNDDHTAFYGGAADLVDGTLTSIIDFKISSGVFTIPSPNFVNTILLTAGS